QGTSVSIPVLANDTDPDHAPVSIARVTSPAHGTAHVSAGGAGGETIVYASAYGFTGTDTFTYTIADPAGVESTATVTATVLAATNSQPGQLQFSASSYSVFEDGGSTTITIARTGGSTGAVTIHYATSDGTALAGTNYTSASGTLNFGPGETSKSFTIAIHDDGLANGNVTVNLALSNPAGGATVGTPSAAVLTIVGTSGQPGQFQFSATVFSTPENSGSAIVTVTRTGGSTGTVPVQYATGGGTAVPGKNYTPPSVPLIFTPGETSHTFNIPTLDDGLADGNQTVIVTLSSPG